GDRDFRVFARCKSKKHRMVFAVWILDGSCFATHLNSWDSGAGSGTSGNSTTHPFDYRFVILSVHARPYFFGKLLFDDFLLSYTFDKVRTVIIAAVCYYRHHIGHLKRCDAELSLTDR